MSCPNELLVEYVNNLEKKQRNLIKRKAKLDTYRKLLQKGEPLSSEQTKAVSDYETVSYSIIALKEVAEGVSELQAKVECASKESEKILARKNEEFALNTLQNLVPVIEILCKIQSPSVKAAIIKASSLQQYKTLEMASKLIFMQTPPATESAVMGDDLFKEPSLNLLKFGTCAPTSIQSSKGGKSRAPTFAAVREICVNLLVDPTVRSALAAPYSEPNVTNKKQSPRPSESTKIADKVSIQIAPPKAPEPITPNFVTSVPAEEILDSVINPIKTSFNFLQASHVDAPPVWQLEMEPAMNQPIDQSNMPNLVQQETHIQQHSQQQPHVLQPMRHTHEHPQHLEPQPTHQQTPNQPQQQDQMQSTVDGESHQLHAEFHEQPHQVHEPPLESKPFVLHNSEEHQSEQFKPNQLNCNEVTGSESPRSIEKPTDLSAPKKKRNKKEKVSLTTTNKPEQPQNEPTSLQAVMAEEVLLEAKPSQKMKSWAALCGGGNYPPVITEASKPVVTIASSAQPEQIQKVETNEKQHVPYHGREDFNRQPRGGFRGGRGRGNGQSFRAGRGRGVPRGPYQNGQNRNDFNNGHPAPIQSTC